MGLEIIYKNGQTQLDPEDLEGLKIKTISSQEELNIYEQANIEKARTWLLSKKRLSPEKVLNEAFILTLHKKMLGDVWRWAGLFRNRNTSIGVDKSIVPMEIRNLLDDCKYWIENKTFPNDEIVIRFKHRLIKIHPFNNGNGRHSRLMADILMEKVFNLQPFIWGDCYHDNNRRDAYLKALHLADVNDFSLLFDFCRSKKKK